MSSLGGMPWGGHPQPTDCLLSAVCPGKGTHKGRPYRLSSLGGMPWEGHPQGAPLPIVFSRRYALGRAPTRGAPTDCLLSAVCPGKGTHKGAPTELSSLGGMGRAPTRGAPRGRPYRLSSLGGMPWEGHPQGAPLPIVFSLYRRVCPGEGTHKGGEGTHKGCPYRLSSLGGMPWEGRPRGVLKRAPTRGAPTRLSSLGVMPYPIQAASRGFVPI